MNFRLQNNREYGCTFFIILLITFGFCCTPEVAMASRGVTFSWHVDQGNLEGYRLYYGKKSRYYSRQPGSESYEYYVDLVEMAHCSTDRDDPRCEALGAEEVSCTNIDSDNPKCVVKGLPGGLSYFAVTAYNDKGESGYSDELTGVLDKDGNLVSLQLEPVRKYAHLDAAYDLLLR